MRIQAKKPILLRGKILGGKKPLLCLPILAASEQELEKQTTKAMEFSPDIIEWRVDSFEGAKDVTRVVKALKGLRQQIKDIPLIFTFRSYNEGGLIRVEDRLRCNIILESIATGLLDVVDIEFASCDDMVMQIKACAKKIGTSLILSYHNFNMTPSVDFIVKKIKDEISLGADIAKVAVMPKNHQDVLNLLYATLEARQILKDPPIITVSMGELGKITRIMGYIFGSDMSFASGEKASAPGQIHISQLRELINNLGNGA